MLGGGNGGEGWLGLMGKGGGGREMRWEATKVGYVFIIEGGKGYWKGDAKGLCE